MISPSIAQCCVSIIFNMANPERRFIIKKTFIIIINFIIKKKKGSPKMFPNIILGGKEFFFSFF